MPTIMTHAIVPLAVAVAAGPVRISPKVALAGAMLAMAPDADVIGFAFGVDYGDAWGHRGATHSLVFACLIAAGVALIWKQARSLWAFLFLAFAIASHGLLDTLTDGGLGAALWWPFDHARIFAPITPVRVSPIGADFFSARGWETLQSELVWIWLPCALLLVAGWTIRKVKAAQA